MIRQEQCNKVCRILDDVLANRPTERDSLIVAVRKAFDALEKQRWIPCNERQPDVNGWYITTISGEICGQDRAFSGMSEFANGKWMSGDDVDETEMTIAWMPLPEPARLEND
jgi:hypothetical protein